MICTNLSDMYYVVWFVLCWMICTIAFEWFVLCWITSATLMIHNLLNDLWYVEGLALR